MRAPRARRLTMDALASSVAALALVSAGACGEDRVPTAPKGAQSATATVSPTPTPTATPTPTPTLTPSPSPSPNPISVSGTVVDGDGVPIANAFVEIDYNPPPGRLPWVATRTDGAGRYEVKFEPAQSLWNVQPPTAGLIFSYGKGLDFSGQLLPWGPTAIAMDLVVRTRPVVTAGESVRVAVDSHTSICWDLEDWFIPTRRCAMLKVVAPANGTLVVEAKPTEDGAALPLVFTATSGFYRGQTNTPGRVTLREVVAGKSYDLFVAAPVGVMLQQYDVTTSMQPAVLR